MKRTILACLTASVFALSSCSNVEAEIEEVSSQKIPTQISLDLNAGDISAELATRFSALALDCVQKEFPNKISRTTDTAEEIGRPKVLFPVFYGCFDWHSAVHGHWLLVRLTRLAPDAEWTQEARRNRGSWERPYGWAWLLQLTAELREWDDPQAKIWLERLKPLEEDIAVAFKQWLPKLAYPIRLGTHNQSAFAFTLMWDWAETAGDTEMLEMLKSRSLAFHKNDVNCPLAYEPSGEDFLSPCLMEADLMRRVLSQEEFSKWLTTFLPTLPMNGSDDWLAPGVVKDASDGKLVHLDGVNFSRAWNLYNIAAALPEDDTRRAALIASAQRHEVTGIAAACRMSIIQAPIGSPVSRPI